MRARVDGQRARVEKVEEGEPQAPAPQLRFELGRAPLRLCLYPRVAPTLAEALRPTFELELEGERIELQAFGPGFNPQKEVGRLAARWLRSRARRLDGGSP